MLMLMLMLGPGDRGFKCCCRTVVLLWKQGNHLEEVSHIIADESIFEALLPVRDESKRPFQRKRIFRQVGLYQPQSIQRLTALPAPLRYLNE